MRILYLADSYRPSRSACANRTCVLVQALRDAGHDVQVLASTDSLIGAPEDYQPPEYVTFFKTYPLVEKTLVNRLRNNFGGAHEAVKAAKRLGDFDLVVCTTPPLLLTSSAVKIAQAKRAKLVLDVRDIWPDVAYEMGSFAPNSLYGRFFAHEARKAYAVAALVASVSPGKVKKLKDRVPNGDVILVPNGIDESLLDNENDLVLAEHLRLGGSPVCVYVGNIGLAQGLGTLLDIAKARPAVRFLLLGDGADRAKLQERANLEGIGNIEFCGTVDARGVYTVLKRAAISYVPLVSSRLRDSIPTKMYEALACGCPVLLAASGDAANLLDACGLGKHASPEEPDALLAAFDWLMAHPFSDEERSAASAWVIENHSRQRFAKLFVKEIEQLESCHA
ncbi:glycosyltransferase family 4 protein [uncultured Enorma sp.]|uniref:glycosyltransferase family 4 protein n=1 Tax=uncultured Enorma sp. TaxID=1714346 RepID=UPI0025993C19|nr:glycosyltransferase family 4 protein [uncultured Enorma sp.]